MPGAHAVTAAVPRLQSTPVKVALPSASVVTSRVSPPGSSAAKLAG